MTDKNAEPTAPKGERLMPCPECKYLVTRSQAYAHAGEHWPANITPYPEHQEAIKRQRELYDFADSGHR